MPVMLSRLPIAGNGKMVMMKKLFAIFMLGGSCALAQVNSGEVRLRILDPSGAGVRTAINVSSAGSGYNNTFTTDPSGASRVQRLAYGIYLIGIEHPGFASV